ARSGPAGRPAESGTRSPASFPRAGPGRRIDPARTRSLHRGSTGDRHGAAAMPTEGERIQALGDFLRESFALHPLGQFLVTKGYADVADAVHTDVGWNPYAFEVVQELGRRGLIDAAFFDRLAQERPARAAEIQSLKGSWLVEGKTGASPSGRTTQPCNL